jgi:predicted nucleotidyltransferase
MNNDTVYDVIQKTVRSLLPECRVLLFGSRARGTEDRHSDYDLMIITPYALTQKESIAWSTKLNRAIVHAIHAPVDILVFSEEEVVRKQLLPGHIVRTAMREGVAL